MCHCLTGRSSHQIFLVQFQMQEENWSAKTNSKFRLETKCIKCTMHRSVRTSNQTRDSLVQQDRRSRARYAVLTCSFTLNAVVKRRHNTPFNFLRYNMYNRNIQKHNMNLPSVFMHNRLNSCASHIYSIFIRLRLTANGPNRISIYQVVKLNDDHI